MIENVNRGSLPSVEEVRNRFNYDPDTGVFTCRVRCGKRGGVGMVAGGLNVHGYWFIGINKRQYNAATLAWLHHYGEPPAGQVDHINRNRADNRIANLRLCTKAENMRNRTSGRVTATGVKGVSVSNGRYIARIMKDRESVYLGTFDSIERAAAAYAVASTRMHGEFSCLE